MSDRMQTWRALTVILALGGLVPASAAQEVAPFRPAAELIANPRLADAAMAFADPDRPVIYYNPSLLREVGPELAAFLLAHEEGHIVYRHRRPERSSFVVDTLEVMLRRYELDADCYAAGRLSVERPEAVARAIGYFRSLGSFRADREHPTGAERAARIAACLGSTYGAGDEPG